VIGEDEIRTWEWIAAASLIAVVLASFLLGDKNVQVAKVDPTDHPPMVYQEPEL
jgi:hypothetical protein